MAAIAPNKKTAVVLFNLGGPDRLEAVQPFLFNLFYDPAIISLPNPLRGMLASFISRRRAPIAQKIYAHLGDKSPILENTHAQQAALEASLKNHGNVKVFTVMRYWHPRAKEVVKQVQQFAPDHIILLPLYPQFSTTTTASSFAEWRQAADAIHLKTPTHAVCCYPVHPEFIRAQAQLIRTHLEAAKKIGGAMRLLFSAHGLPEKIIKNGDPYQAQVEATTQAVLKELKTLGIHDADYVNCYQSRVGPMKWIGPSTEDELRRAGAENTSVVLVPIAFVSEHSETLVELDIEYAHLAKEAGVPNYIRVPTVSTDAHFIAALADLCLSVGDDIACVAGAKEMCANWNKCGGKK